MIKSAFKESLG